MRAVWFIRHEESVPPAGDELPVFGISHLQDQDEDQVGDHLPNHREDLGGDGVGAFLVWVLLPHPTPRLLRRTTRRWPHLDPAPTDRTRFPTPVNGGRVGGRASGAAVGRGWRGS